MTCSTAGLGLSEAAARYERRLVAIAQHQREEMKRRRQRAAELAERMERVSAARHESRLAVASQVRQKVEARQQAVLQRRKQLREIEEQQRMAISLRLAAAAQRRNVALRSPRAARTPSAHRYAFGSSTPRRLTHLTNLDRHMQTYDVRLKPRQVHAVQVEQENRPCMSASATAPVPHRPAVPRLFNMSRSVHVNVTSVSDSDAEKKLIDRSRALKMTQVRQKRPVSTVNADTPVKKQSDSRSNSAAPKVADKRLRSRSPRAPSRRSTSAVPNEPTPAVKPPQKPIARPPNSSDRKPNAVKTKKSVKSKVKGGFGQQRSPPSTPPFKKKQKTQENRRDIRHDNVVPEPEPEPEPAAIKMDSSSDQHQSPNDPKPSNLDQSLDIALPQSEISQPQSEPSPDLRMVVTTAATVVSDGSADIQTGSMSLADELSLLLGSEGAVHFEGVAQGIEEKSAPPPSAPQRQGSPSPIPPAPTAADDYAYLGDDECHSSNTTAEGNRSDSGPKISKPRVVTPTDGGSGEESETAESDEKSREKLRLEREQAELERKKVEAALAEKIRSHPNITTLRLEQEDRERRKNRLQAIMSRTRGAATTATNTSGQHSPPAAESSSSEAENAAVGPPDASGTKPHPPPGSMLSSASAKALQRLSASPAITKLLQKHAKQGDGPPVPSDSSSAASTQRSSGTQLISATPTMMTSLHAAKVTKEAESSGAESLPEDPVSAGSFKSQQSQVF